MSRDFSSRLHGRSTRFKCQLPSPCLVNWYPSGLSGYVTTKSPCDLFSRVVQIPWLIEIFWSGAHSQGFTSLAVPWPDSTRSYHGCENDSGGGDSSGSFLSNSRRKRWL